MLFAKKKIYSVKTLGAEELKKNSAPVLKVEENIHSLVASMTLIMNSLDGVGLAAPQVGVNLRLIVFGVPLESMGANPTPGELLLLPRMPLAVLNPEIIEYSKDVEVSEEGCLSVPNIYGPVCRPRLVKFRAKTIEGDIIECECGNLLGRCIQHEMDHLDGKLFIDRMENEELEKINLELTRLKTSGKRNNFERKVKA